MKNYDERTPLQDFLKNYGLESDLNTIAVFNTIAILCQADETILSEVYKDNDDESNFDGILLLHMILFRGYLSSTVSA
jgi:hypothetical protein